MTGSLVLLLLQLLGPVCLCHTFAKCDRGASHHSTCLPKNSLDIGSQQTGSQSAKPSCWYLLETVTVKNHSSGTLRAGSPSHSSQVHGDSRTHEWSNRWAAQQLSKTLRAGSPSHSSQVHGDRRTHEWSNRWASQQLSKSCLGLLLSNLSW